MLLSKENLNKVSGLLHYLNESFDGGDLEVLITVRDKDSAENVGMITRCEMETPYQLSISGWGPA